MQIKFLFPLVALLFLTSINLYPSQLIKLIKAVTIKKNRVEITINDDFKRTYLNDDFFAEYDEDINLESLDYSIVTMPFIMNVISLVWISGKNYQIDSMDAELYESLKKIKEVFKKLYPKTQWNGQLIPKNLVHNASKSKQPENHVALLFSGGLDSTYSSLKHIDKPQLHITIWGHFDTPLNNTEEWQDAKNRIIKFSQQYNNDNTFIKSNYYTFLNRTIVDNNKLSPEIIHWRLSAMEGLGWAGLAAPIIFAKGINKLLIAASFSMEYPYIQIATPFIDNLISFAGIAVSHDGFLSRVDKCKKLVKLCNKYSIKKPSLKVCPHYNKGRNCCGCVKCLLTINAFLSFDENYQSFGFPTIKSEVVNRTKKYLQTRELTHIHWWYFASIQEEIKKRTQISDYLQWLSDFNIKQKIRHDMKNLPTINWHEFEVELKRCGLDYNS